MACGVFAAAWPEGDEAIGSDGDCEESRDARVHGKGAVLKRDIERGLYGICAGSE